LNASRAVVQLRVRIHARTALTMGEIDELAGRLPAGDMTLELDAVSDSGGSSSGVILR
jgi:hypothetical protein